MASVIALFPMGLGLFILHRGAAQMGDGFSLVAGCTLMSAGFIILALGAKK